MESLGPTWGKMWCSERRLVAMATISEVLCEVAERGSQPFRGRRTQIVFRGAPLALKIFKFELLQCKSIIVSGLIYCWRWIFRDHGAYQIDSRTFDFRSYYRTLLASVAEGYRREQE